MYLTSCGDEKPEGILSEPEMTEILIDVYTGEGKVSSLNVKRDSSMAIYKVYEDKIFEKYGIERDYYKKSLSYYYDHPKALGQIYEAVLDSLNVREQRMKDNMKENMQEKYNSKGRPRSDTDQKENKK